MDDLETEEDELSIDSGKSEKKYVFEDLTKTPVGILILIGVFIFFAWFFRMIF